MENNNMKTTNRVLFTVTLAAILTALNAPAQYQPTGRDGITASPKVRQMLNERPASRPTVLAPTVTVTSNNASEGITASPKFRQIMAAQKRIISNAPSTEVANVGYRPTGSDGITASPKLRQQLGERAAEFIIAPLK